MKNTNDGNRGINRKAAVLTGLLLAFVILIAGVLGLKLAHTADGSAQDKDVLLHVERQSGMSTTPAMEQPTGLPEESSDGRVGAAKKEETVLMNDTSEWQIGTVIIKETVSDAVVVLEYTNVSFTPKAAILYDEGQYKTVSAERINRGMDGKILFYCDRLKEGTWYLAIAMNDDQSLGTTNLYLKNREKYLKEESMEEYPVVRDSEGVAIN